MDPQIYEPKVIKNREFKEIASDFTNPLEAVREAISNALDAGASEIKITAERREIEYQPKLVLIFEDDGCGMDLDRLYAFFDLGNSKWENTNTIGEKGHGTKIYYHSEKLIVETVNKNKEKYTAEVENPWLTLRKGASLEVKIIGPQKVNSPSKTVVTIIGFFDNKLEPFTHENLKDYIKWFTAFGSIKPYFSSSQGNAKLFIKGVDKDDFEEIPQGHPFPNEDYDLNEIMKRIKQEGLGGNVTDYFCKIWKEERDVVYRTIKTKIQIMFAIEGEKIRQLPRGVHATERYGLWVAKSGIPIERKNDWLFPDKAIWTQFHIIVNCDDFHLTANRGSIGNSPSELTEGVKKEIKDFYDKIQKEEIYKKWKELKEKEELERKKEKEWKELEKRLKNLDRRENIEEIKNITIKKPKNESETLHLLSSLIILNKFGIIDKIEELDFEILDIETKTGIDLIISLTDPVTKSETYKVVEVEHKLENFVKHKHFFKQIHGIICWEKGRISPGTEIMDLEGNKYELKKSQKGEYFFQNNRDATDIKKVYVLSEIVKKIKI